MIDFVASVERDGAAFIEVVGSGDLATPVPSCPGWALRDLALHQGEVHRWAMRHIAADADVERRPPEVADADLVGWLTEGLGLIAAMLGEADPRAPVWTFGPKPRVMSFWSRRMAHELVVHRWDAEASLGAPRGIDAELAADGVDEVFTVFVPRQLRQARMVEPGNAVEVTLPDGRSYSIGTGEPVATVTGPPDALLLALWRRIPVTELALTGDRTAVEGAFARALTP